MILDVSALGGPTAVVQVQYIKQPFALLRPLEFMKTVDATCVLDPLVRLIET